MVPIIGRVSSFHVFVVCTLRGWSFKNKIERTSQTTRTPPDSTLCHTQISTPQLYT